MHQGGQRAWKFCCVRTVMLQPAWLEQQRGCADGGSAGASGPMEPCPCWTHSPVRGSAWLGHRVPTELGRACGASRDRAEGEARGSNETSAGVGMASGAGSPLLEVVDAPGSALAGRRVQDDEQSVPSQKTKLVTVDKFAGKLSHLLLRN